MLADCTDLTAYLKAYGPLLGARATAALDPRFVPGRDVHPPALAALDDHFHRKRKSRLFLAQKDVIAALVRLWETEKAAFLVGECGCGKSAMAAAAAHVAARGRPYRGLILCPDHLITKWATRELPLTCPGAVVHTFQDWREVLAEAMGPGQERPSGAEWWVLGRDQSKGDPLWEPRFAPRKVPFVERAVLKRLRAAGTPWSALTRQVAACPRCGQVVADKDGNPIAVEDLKAKKRTCTGTIVRYRRDPEQDGDAALTEESACGEPLWQFVAARTPLERQTMKADRARRGLKAATAPCRWAPYRIVHSRMRRHFDYLILDEVHELKGDDTVAQANAAGALAASARKVVACTGTLIGGYADHLFPILMRLAPASLVEGGFAWKGFDAFNKVYGKIETTIITGSRGDVEDRHDEDTRGGGGDEDHTHSKGSSRRVYRRCRPGVMPQLFGDHLLDKTLFLMLEQVTEGLPPLDEEIIPVVMDPDLSRAYHQIEDRLRDTVKEMLVKGDKSLLGAMLMALLGYPDHPYGYGTIGYHKHGLFVPVCNAPDLDRDVVRAKEQALLALVDRERARGRKVWVYLQMTDKRDVGARLQRVLGDAGFRADQMHSEKPKRREREAWIYKNAPKLDVVLSHPKLVETGMDLFALDGNHNFPTLCFGQTGYNLFTLRQASRRSWRIGQPLPCRTAFLYYAGTMQESAMSLMGLKLVAAEALEGKFSAEGLAAMGEDSDATLALARALAEGVRPDDSWRRDLGYGSAPLPLPVASCRPEPELTLTLKTRNAPLTTAPLTPAELATLKRLFGRMKGRTS